MKPKKTLEYDDAPSGFVTLYNYKEPFMKYKNGFGFQGVLLFDGESDTVQCHICGKWYESLGNHVYHSHGVIAQDYKEMVGLSNSTALIGEKFRQKLIAKSLGKRMKNLIKGRKKTKKQKEAIGKTLKNLTREKQNMTGTCPAQLIDRLQTVYNELGYTPYSPHHVRERKISNKELVIHRKLGAVITYERVFGSWENALIMANIPVRKPSSTGKHQVIVKEITEHNLRQFVKKFHKLNDRYPTDSDYNRGLVFSKELLEPIIKKI